MRTILKPLPTSAPSVGARADHATGTAVATWDDHSSQEPLVLREPHRRTQGNGAATAGPPQPDPPGSSHHPPARELPAPPPIAAQDWRAVQPARSGSQVP